MEDDDTTELPIDGVLDLHTVTDAHPAPPLRGRTYSLRGAGTSSDPFYSALAAATDALVARVPAEVLLGELRRAARHPRRLRRLAARPDDSVVAAALAMARERLGGYLEDVEGFLAELPLRQRFGTTLTTTREQYLLAMLEVELTNCTGIAGFLAAERRIALLPHCAKADEATCKARHHRLDEVCAACTPGCTLDAVSRTLRRHRVEPYIWMTASLSALVKEHRPGALGILGVACLAELVAGMRRVAAAGVAVVGLPLDANRCSRWFPQLLPTGFNLAALERLLGGGPAAATARRLRVD